MAGSFSDALENALLDCVFGKRNSSQISTGSAADGQLNPSTLWVGLWNVAITDSDDATLNSETGSTGAATNYARLKIKNSSTHWTAASGGSLQNSTNMTFTPSSGASTGWGVVKAVAILNTDSTTKTGSSGAILAWADLDTDQTVSKGNTVRFSSGNLKITLT